MNTQGERLLQFIESKGSKYSQQKFADSIGISKGAVNKVCTNIGDFSGKNYFKIAEVHNINLNWLILGIGDMFIKKEVAKNDDLENLIEKTFNNYLGKLGLTDEEISRRLSAGMPTPKNEK